MSKNLDKIIDGLDEELINHAAETMAKSKNNTLKNAHAKRVIRTSAAAAACLCTVIVGIIVSGRLGLSVSGSTVTASAEQIPDEVSDTSAENTSEATEYTTTQIMVGAYTTEEILLIYINQSDTIEELNQAIYKAYSDMVTSVCVYKNESDYKNNIEVPEGALEKGMIIHIEFNYGEDVTAEPKEFTTVKIGEQQEIHLPCIRCINY